MPTTYRPTLRDIHRMSTRLEKHSKQEVCINIMVFAKRECCFLHIGPTCTNYNNWPSLLEAFNKALESPHV